MRKEGALFWITGLAGSGKTTIGNYLYYKLKTHTDRVVILDGDVLKSIVDSNVGYSSEDRKKRAYKYSALCKALTDQGLIVICCTIAMFEEVRQRNRQMIKNYIEVFLDVPFEILAERDKKGMYTRAVNGEQKNLAGVNLEVEYPQNPDVVLKNDGTIPVKKSVEIILEMYHKKCDSYNRDVQYWNEYYQKEDIVEEPSLFARFAVRHMQKGRKLLDVGCGNGRDSIFFLDNLKLYVTGIDISDEAIHSLNDREKNNTNAIFICDDFTCSETIYAEQYDYIYSRFSLHAINEAQEDIFLDNALKALKMKGKLFIEARSVNDELYGQGMKVGRDEFINNGHYRRFIRKDQLEEKLLKKGFSIVVSLEERNFAPFGIENPKVIRIICSKEKITLD